MEDVMRVKCEYRGEGMGPRERVVSVRTFDGLDEEVVVDLDSLLDSALVVNVVDEREDRVLVQFPQESMRGNWRVWMNRNAVVSAN